MTRDRTARMLAGLVALIMLTACLLHTFGIAGAYVAIDSSSLPESLRGGAKALWLANSVTLLAASLFFGWTALRKDSVDGITLFSFACIPSGSAVSLYAFMPGFVGAHLMLLAALLAFGALVLSLLLQVPSRSSR